MPSDTVIPKSNEAEFAEIASRLGYKKLCFLYNFEEYDEKKAKKLEFIKSSQNIPIETGFIVNQKNLNKASKHSKMLVAKSSENDRVIIESGKINMIYGLEDVHKRDSLHQRASGLNHVLCELAKKNDVAIGFSYSSLSCRDNISSAILIGRMMQNIRLCQKFKAKIFIGSFSGNPYCMRAHHDVMMLFKILGKAF